MKKRYFFIITILIIILLYVTNITQIPSRIFLMSGEKIQLKKLAGITLTKSQNKIQETWQDKNLDTSKMDVKIFGTLKVKEVSVTTYPKIKVIPTGNLIGLKLYTNGVLIIGTTEIKSINNEIEKPYELANIKEGDIILELDNQEVDSSKTLQNIINSSKGKELEIKYTRHGEIYTSKIQPTQTSSNEYKLGLWVRDSASGVGTMAFYEPETKKFAALGHGISDSDTGELLDVQTGEIVNSKIVNITKGQKGFPGEIKGSISKQTSIGNVNKNTNFGIFGTVNGTISTLEKYSAGIEIALREEIQEGEATILTMLEDGKIEEYNIIINSINIDNNTNNKSMQIEITDERLIHKTGGIICGMSGSPIIQNNKLVGALTNVLVSDPKIGYGVFADIMIKEMIK